MPTQPTFFGEPDPPRDISGMVRREGPETSEEAAEVVAPHRRALQERVWRAFQAHGPMSDEQLENLPEFEGYGPSTVRKRRTELSQRGELAEDGTCLNSRGRTVLVFRVA